MLQSIKNKAQGLVAYILVILIAITFALWGVDALVGNMGADSSLAKVNGEVIDKHEVEKNSQIYIQNIIANNPKIDVDSLNLDLIRQNVLSDLISQKLIKQATQKFNLAINPDKVEKYIVNFPQFADDSGRFDLENYKATLQRMGETPKRFRAMVEDSMLSEQLLNGVGNTAFVLDNEVRDVLNLKNQKRTFRYIELPNSRLKSKLVITEEELADFYRKNKNRYLSEEKIRVSYVIFDPKTLEKEFEPTQEDYKLEYEKYKVSILANNTKRRVAHILLKYENKGEKQLAFDRLTKIKNEVEQGKDFGKFAQENSMDISTANKGGDLGFMDFYAISPLFANEVSKLDKVGQLSEIVETKQGLHLIKLLDIEKPVIKSMAEVKSELRENFMATPLRAKTTEVLEELKNLSFSEETISKLAKQANLTLEQSSWLTKDKLSGLWKELAVKQNLFSQSTIIDGIISEPLKLEDGSYLLFQKEQYEPEKEIPFETIKSTVKADLTNKKLVDLNKKEADELLEDLKSGKSYELDWKVVKNSTRENIDIKREIINYVFSMNPAKMPNYAVIELMSGDLALLELLKVDANPAVLDSEAALFSQYMDKSAHDKSINYLLLNLRKDAEVIIN